jgi:hypothetical protein
MLALTQDAVVVCAHVVGKVTVEATQQLVRIDRRQALVSVDPEGRAIKGCPNVGPNLKPCQQTLQVKLGYSTLVQIDGRRLVLDNLSGFTDGTPPGFVRYNCIDAGQKLVRVDQ